MPHLRRDYFLPWFHDRPRPCSGPDDARKYLLAPQHSDGSWLTPSKNVTKSTEPERLSAHDEICHYWGTAWVVIGLLETLNKPDK